MAHSLLSRRRRHPEFPTSTSAGVVVAAAVLAGAGACYTGPINMRPRIEQIIGPEPVVRGQAAAFSAIATDPDKDEVTIDWYHSPGSCGQSPERRGPALGVNTYTVPADDTAGVFCVWATARDSYGATSGATPWEGNPDNKPPVVSLVVEGEDVATQELWKYQSPFSLHRLIMLDASGTTDPDDTRDQLTFTWDSEAALVDCPADASRWLKCLVPDHPGPVTVKLTVQDSARADATATRMFEVADDQLPCLGDTVPGLDASMISASTETTLPFYVEKVIDDGEPYPALPGGDPTAFTWFLGPEAGPLERQAPSGTLNALLQVLPGRYHVGDRVKVRVEISDRNALRSQHLLSDCQTDICLNHAGCRQRMTWLITYAL